MRFLSVTYRELLVAAHRRATYRTRWSAALAAGLAAAVCFLGISNFTNPARVGIVLFHLVGSGCLLLAGLAGLFLTADAIAAERREGTLGLLYLTELGPFDVLGGKLIALGANAAGALLAVFPVLSVAWILGGFSGAEVMRLLLGGLNVLFVSLVVGLAVSAWVERQGAAMGGTAAILGAVALWPLLVVPVAGPSGSWLAGLSPLKAIGAASGLAYQPNTYWLTLALGHATGWLFLALAAIGLKRGWRNCELTSNGVVTRPRVRRCLPDAKPEDLARLAIQGLLFGQAWSKQLAWYGVAIPFTLLLLVAAIFDKEPAFAVYLGTSVVVGFVLKGVFAWEAAAPLVNARRDGGIELLLSTPATDRDIRSAQSKHLTSTFLAPMLTAYALDWFVIAIFASPQADTGLGICMWLGAVVLTYLQARAMTLGGLWWGVREERAGIAFAKNFLLGTVISIPLLWFCCVGFAVPVLLISWLTAKLRTPLRVLLTEGSLPNRRF